MKLFIALNKDSFLLSHRKELVEKAVKVGHQVTVIAKNTGFKEAIEHLGAKFISLPINPTGTNIFQELKTLWFLYRLFRNERPDIVHNVGLKTILWGGLACKLARVHGIVHAVSGLGIMFSGEKLSLAAKGILSVIKFSCHRPRVTVIFQNKDDEALLLEHHVVRPDQCTFIKGSGVDLEIFAYTPEITDERIHVIFTARMVKEKGVTILVEAANLLKSKLEGMVDFWLCGGLSDNPLALKEEEMKSLCDGEYIKWLGHRSDILELLKRAHIVAFPSYYREGVPKSLIEANAVGRPIVTTDSVGCRDSVIDGYNGYIIPIKNSEKLAEKLEELIVNKRLRERMGKNARAYAEQNFSLTDVIKKHLAIYNELGKTS